MEFDLVKAKEQVVAGTEYTTLPPEFLARTPCFFARTGEEQNK
jgi:hypothetical protein